MAHTPGPFAVFPTVALAGKQLIAIVHSPCGMDLAIGSTTSDVASYETEDNAHLFAASTAMLEALHKIVNNWGDLHHKDLMQARRAIAQAEGRAP